MAAGGASNLSGSGGTAGDGGSYVAAPDYMKTGTFDLNEVYLFGTLSEGACYRDAIAHWSTPNFALTGFDCDVGTSNLFIRPSDGRLVFYLRKTEVTDFLAFVPDGTGPEPYPNNPHTNDLPLLTVCANPRAYFLDPEGGESVYLCYGSHPCLPSSATKCAYYSESKEEYPVPSGYYLVRLGFGGHALLGQGGPEQSWTVLGPNGELVPVDQYFNVSTIRAHQGGFWLLRSSEASIQRWNLRFDGTVVLDGVYPPPPLTSRYGGSCVFEGQGALVCFGRSTDVVFEDHILRAELGADEAKIVYTESSHPLVKIHISSLVSGP